MSLPPSLSLSLPVFLSLPGTDHRAVPEPQAEREIPDFYRNVQDLVPDHGNAMDLANDTSSVASSGSGIGIKPGEIWIPELILDDVSQGSSRRGCWAVSGLGFRVYELVLDDMSQSLARRGLCLSVCLSVCMICTICSICLSVCMYV